MPIPLHLAEITDQYEISIVPDNHRLHVKQSLPIAQRHLGNQGSFSSVENHSPRLQQQPRRRRWPLSPPLTTTKRFESETVGLCRWESCPNLTSSLASSAKGDRAPVSPMSRRGTKPTESSFDCQPSRPPLSRASSSSSSSSFSLPPTKNGRSQLTLMGAVAAGGGRGLLQEAETAASSSSFSLSDPRFHAVAPMMHMQSEPSLLDVRNIILTALDNLGGNQGDP